MAGFFCCHCANFIPDTIGDGMGIGNCKVLEDYKAKGASQKAIDAAYEKLGGRLFWGGDGGYPRDCIKFKQK